ncbi:small ribosomal subunit biogenesis GTPase RsgA [Dapis sp. BLCC M126]|uniref:small ribosomal subunit biogenesis GTPase RsgA n=1 Tax=Dapis sp. BLCC M126 TaxID=3400189 RepID=UPI003CE6D4A5
MNWTSEIGDILEIDNKWVGTVVAVQANFYQVKIEKNHNSIKNARENLPEFLLCTRRSRLKKIGQKVMVGDRVIIEDPDWTGGRGAVAEVLPRETELDRPPIANANQVMLIFALAEPDLDPVALTRFLLKAESTGLEICLCLSKCDLVSATKMEKWRSQISQWGYEPFFISVQTEAGLGAAKNTSNSLWEKLRNKITVISGPSGVGKSSLINYLIPNVNLRVSAVSGKLSRGRHTTRHVELFELPNGGLLADTPGFNQPQLDCEPIELAYLFPEARNYLAEGSCQFSDCLHRDEPNCVVRGNWDRYEYYLMFLEEAIARQEALQQKPDAESNLKAKTSSGGKQKFEPKLASKKYRRSSRKVEHQQLQDLCEEFDEFS